MQTCRQEGLLAPLILRDLQLSVHWVFKVTPWAVFYKQVLAQGLLPLWKSIPCSCRGRAQPRQPGVPTLARVMQVQPVYPCGTSWSWQGSHRQARIQLDLNPAMIRHLWLPEESGSAAMFILSWDSHC